MSTRPVLVTVDDDPAVSRAIARDLRKRHGDDHRVVRAESGTSALEALRELTLRGEPTALLLADHRMPGMTGVDFLEQAMDVVPGAKRVLPTAYAGTDAAGPRPRSGASASWISATAASCWSGSWRSATSTAATPATCSRGRSRSPATSRRCASPPVSIGDTAAQSSTSYARRSTSAPTTTMNTRRTQPDPLRTASRAPT